MESIYSDLSFLSLALQDALCQAVKVVSAEPFGCGDIHHSYKIEVTDGRCYFIKCNSLEFASLLQHEFYALSELAETNCLYIPKTYGYVERENYACLIMEWLDLKAQGDDILLGQCLAQLHQISGSRFGWEADNFIGYTPQKNNWNDSWVDYWRENRLRPQLDKAFNSEAGHRLKPWANDFYCASDKLLRNHHPKPALLHGDLWGGNKGFLPNGTPILFDPASYYGDSETDIAFTHLFGGFSKKFYQAYDEIAVENTASQLGVSIEAYLIARSQRQVLYNTYHQLNHLNMFGDCYLMPCLHAIQEVISF